LKTFWNAGFKNIQKLWEEQDFLLKILQGLCKFWIMYRKKNPKKTEIQFKG
jgi:hypothetical protein